MLVGDWGRGERAPYGEILLTESAVFVTVLVREGQKEQSQELTNWKTNSRRKKEFNVFCVWRCF